MTAKERMKELIELFADADKRSELNKAQMAYSPTVGEILGTMAN